MASNNLAVVVEVLLNHGSNPVESGGPKTMVWQLRAYDMLSVLLAHGNKRVESPISHLRVLSEVLSEVNGTYQTSPVSEIPKGFADVYVQ